MRSASDVDQKMRAPSVTMRLGDSCSVLTGGGPPRDLKVRLFSVASVPSHQRFPPIAMTSIGLGV
jgi:hypothetical protein